MFNLKLLIQDHLPPPTCGPGLSFCTDKNARIYDYELRLRGQSLVRGSKRALSEKDLRRMLKNVYPEQIEELQIVKCYKKP